MEQATIDPVASAEEIVVEDEPIEESLVPNAEVGLTEGDPTHVVDREIEMATDAAFAALELTDDDRARLMPRRACVTAIQHPQST